VPEKDYQNERKLYQTTSYLAHSPLQNCHGCDHSSDHDHCDAIDLSCMVGLVMLSRWIDQMQQRWRYRHYPQSLDIDQVSYRLAAEDSARYVVQHMKTVPNYQWDLDLHRAVSDQRLPGHVCEFGVATGRTIRHFSRCMPGQIIHGFDSFDGLPESWSWLWPQGSFRQAQPPVPDTVRLHVGLFDQTLPLWLSTHPGAIALMHIDCDLYSATRTVLGLCADRLVPGTIIVFDEYLNHVGWQLDEFRAWQEFCDQHQRRYHYVGRVGCHQQVAVQIDA